MVVSAIFLSIGKLPSGAFVTCLKFTLAAYVLASVSQTVLLNTIQNTNRVLGSFEEKEILGRKFVLCALSYLIACLLLYFGYIDSDSYVAILIASVGLYSSGNVLDKLSSLGVGAK